ncbi:unnamed protein product [Ectocarpus sp. 4 AP-2014]|uniref:EsV-1-197 n=1 Tax=Ectocarpus siliculosus virus 1 (isolate New Zealand/Kaikoura/1988) TaxID=654926 RepID=Q8QN92_ESV1K|nr:EsV-1-197 [Ectocarpus siliculosus virus 1]AAK14611.1 EsV-1-197 [Ectocarpus siliculosus virus 1]
MDVHGTRPLGVNWYRLLSIYSDLGKKSNSHEKICDIGTELQSFRADVGTAIQSINTKLDDLINANKIELSGDDLTRLKDDIVSGLKDHVQSSGQECAAPVVCNGESVFFTDDVKELLSDLVRQKSGSLSPGGNGRDEQNYKALGRIEECLGDLSNKTDSDAIKTQLQALQDTISNQAGLTAQDKETIAREIASKVCEDESFRFTDDVNEVLASLVEQKAEALKPDGETKRIATALIAYIEKTLSGAITGAGKRFDSVATKSELEGLRKSIIQKMHSMSSPVDAPDSATITLDDASVQRIVDTLLTQNREEDANIEPWEPDKPDLYKIDTENIRQMFVEKNDDLMLQSAEYEDEALRYSRYIVVAGDEYNKDSVITKKQIVSDLNQRYKTADTVFTKGVNTVKSLVSTPKLVPGLPFWLAENGIVEMVDRLLGYYPLLSTDVYRVLHTFIHHINRERTT